jgi:large subunit ribosomal protein L16
MGKGKGAPEYWVAVVLPGHMMFEISGVNEATAREACRLAACKIGIRSRFVSRESLHK